MIDAVIFDCDGVLVDSEILALEVELGALAEIGLFYREAEFKTRFMGMSTPAFFDALDVDHARKHGRALPEGFRELCDTRYHAALNRLREVPGARAAIERIRCPKAVASSSGIDALKRKLESTDLWRLFEPHIYSADLVARAKPAPDLFLHTAGELGMPPGRCLVLEDSVNGIDAARVAGMRVWGFMGGGHMDANIGARLLEAGAERLVADWREAGEALTSLA